MTTIAASLVAGARHFHNQRRCTMQRCRSSASLAGGAAAAIIAVALVCTWSASAERHVTAAAGHICVVQDGGVVGCYGDIATSGRLNPPTYVPFHAVTAGNDFTCGLTAQNSSLRCWGILPGGTLQLPPADTYFVDAHAGPYHVCGLVPNGTVYCYGDATSRGAINVPPGVVFQGVTAGTNYTCGVARNHTVVCWGDAANPVVANSSVWRAITDAEHVAAGANHACYVRLNGSVGCWGNATWGATVPPAALATNGSVWWLAAGSGMTCAISGPSVPGVMTCWGSLAGNITTSGYEVACASWGCVASLVSNAACGGAVGRVCAPGYAATAGTPMPRGIGIRGSEPAQTEKMVGGQHGKLDGVGTNAQFNGPAGVSYDGAGGVYVADGLNHAIRRVDVASRNVTTVAGVAGTSGRYYGSTPLLSLFNNVLGVEADGAGNVYVADLKNAAVRMLSGEWVAGSTTGATGTTNSGVGTSATFNAVCSVRADVAAGLLFVADCGVPSTRVVRTISIAGSHAVNTLTTFGEVVWDIALNPAAHCLYIAVGTNLYTITYAGVRLAGAEPCDALCRGYRGG